MKNIKQRRVGEEKTKADFRMACNRPMYLNAVVTAEKGQKNGVLQGFCQINP